MSNHARGDSLDMLVKAPTVETKAYGGVLVLDVSASSYEAESGNGAISIVNRSQGETVTTELVWQDDNLVKATGAWQLACTDIKAANTWDDPSRITAQAVTAPTVNDGKATLVLPPLSFTVLTTTTN